MLVLSVNSRVKVKLTDYGYRVYELHQGLLENAVPDEARELVTPNKADAAGFHSFVLWQLMHIFGSVMRNGKEHVFVNGEIFQN